MSLTLGPERQQSSLRSGSGLHIGPTIPLRSEDPVTMTCLFFFMESILSQGTGQLNLGDSSNLDEPLPTSFRFHWKHLALQNTLGNILSNFENTCNNVLIYVANNIS